MSETHAHGSSPTPAFTEAEWHDFHTSDKGAGAAVILLMTAIFATGLILYTIVAIIVAS